jgi:quercetin dioxygenase-like cupin family protein
MTMSYARAAGACLLTGCLLAAPAGAQSPPGPGASGSTVIRTVLATTGLPSVTDTPLHFRLLRVTVPGGESTTYSGATGIIYLLSGGLAVSVDGDRQTLREGDAVVVTKGKTAALRTTGSDPATLLYFMLPRVEELNAPGPRAPLAATELYRTAAPIPGLKSGPYEFSLVRVSFPPRFPLNPPHHRSGAALYYVLSGTGATATGGRTEARPAASIQYEPFDLIHQWTNPGGAPLVLLQANISQEGVPAVIFESGAPSPAPR